jgi:hypothetical protein
MLVADQNRLSWLGIDMRARWKRRMVVVMTYSAYVLTVIGILRIIPGKYQFWFLLAVSAALLLLSVFRDGGPVKSFDEARPTRGALPGKVMLGSLDDWSRYFHGIDFASASEAQQKDVLNRYRVGNYWMPEKPDYYGKADVADEREVMERDRASYLSLRFLALTIAALALYQGALLREGWNAAANAALLLGLAVAAITLPKAIILWTEADPRDAEDLRLAEAESPAGTVSTTRR